MKVTIRYDDHAPRLTLEAENEEELKAITDIKNRHVRRRREGLPGGAVHVYEMFHNANAVTLEW